VPLQRLVPQGWDESSQGQVFWWSKWFHRQERSESPITCEAADATGCCCQSDLERAVRQGGSKGSRPLFRVQGHRVTEIVQVPNKHSGLGRAKITGELKQNVATGEERCTLVISYLMTWANIGGVVSGTPALATECLTYLILQKVSRLALSQE
jgi:hypothetical protein